MSLTLMIHLNYGFSCITKIYGLLLIGINSLNCYQNIERKI